LALSAVAVWALSPADGNVRGAAVGLGPSVDAPVSLFFQAPRDVTHAYEIATFRRGDEIAHVAVELSFGLDNTVSFAANDFWEIAHGELAYDIDTTGEITSSDGTYVPRELLPWALLPDAEVELGDTWVIPGTTEADAWDLESIVFSTDTRARLRQVRRQPGQQGRLLVQVGFQKTTRALDNPYHREAGWRYKHDRYPTAIGQAWLSCDEEGLDGCTLLSASQWMTEAVHDDAVDMVDHPVSDFLRICAFEPLQTPDPGCHDSDLSPTPSDVGGVR